MIKKDEIPTLEIDMNTKCSICSENGVTKSGLCLKCVAKKLKGQAIGYSIIRQAQTELCYMLEEYQKEIDEAYIKADGDLTIALGLKMAGTRMAGEVELTVSINFVESRIKHAVKVTVNENQMQLPGMENS